MFIATIIEQQDQISSLETAMKQMACENLETQKNMASWATNLVSEVQMSLLGKVNDVNSRLNNFSYNVQGFPDNEIKGRQSGDIDVMSKLCPPFFQSLGTLEGRGKNCNCWSLVVDGNKPSRSLPP
jgi:hypothetical protein